MLDAAPDGTSTPAPANSTLGTRVLERVGELGGRVALVEGHQHHARRPGRLIELEVPVAVTADDRDPVTLLEAELAQAAGEPTARSHISA